MICHGGARRFHNAVGINTVMCGDCFLQRRIAVSVVAAINFECVQMDWQFTKRKRRYAARGEIEPRTALRFGPIHVIGMLVSHDSLILVLMLILVSFSPSSSVRNISGGGRFSFDSAAT